METKQKWGEGCCPHFGGRGYLTMELDHYDVVPTNVAMPIIEAHKKEMEAKKEK